MKKLLLTLVLTAVGLTGARAQLDAKVGVGGSFPVVGSANAPDVNPCFTGSLEVGWRMAADSPWRIAVGLEGLHWISKTSPDDGGMYNRRYLFFPLTMGLGFDFSLSESLSLRALAAVGGYYRYQNCMREEHPGTQGFLKDNGVGFALKAAVELLMLDKRLSVGMNVLALGNPFETTQTAFPDRDPAAPGSVRYLNTTLQGFGRCFVGVSLGYRFL